MDPDNCPWDGVTPRPDTDADGDGETNTDGDGEGETTDPNTTVAFESSAASRDSGSEGQFEEEFNRGPVPFPGAGVSVVTAGVVAGASAATAGASTIGSVSGFVGVYSFASWGGLGGYLPFAGDPDDGDDDDDDDTSSSVTSRKLVEMDPATGDMFPTLVLVLIMGAVGIHIICNIVFYCIYMFSIRKDPDFSYWRTLHGYA